MNSENGVTLVALIITIIVLLILASVSLGFVLNGGIIDRAVGARFKSEVSALQEQWNMEKASREMTGVKPKDMNYTLNEALPDFTISEGLVDRLRIEEGDLVFIPSECTDSEKEVLEDMRIFASANV